MQTKYTESVTWMKYVSNLGYVVSIIYSVILFLLCYVFLSTAPTGTLSLSPGTVTTNSITVQWEEVPCLHRNGEITGYTVVARTSGEDNRVVNVNDGNARSATVSGLTPITQYTVSVAAVNSAGTGPATSIDVETGGECEFLTCRLLYLVFCVCDCLSLCPYLWP